MSTRRRIQAALEEAQRRQMRADEEARPYCSNADRLDAILDMAPVQS